MICRSRHGLGGALLALALVLVHAAPAAAQVNETPPELKGVDIEEKPGATLPADVKLRDQDGHDVRLGDYLDGQKPLVVVFAYFRCPMLCSMVLNGLGRGLRELAWTAGDKYRVVTISIDPTDTLEMAREKRKSYLESYGKPVPERGWDFLIGDQSEVKRAADTLGFGYQYDEKQKQYAHAAGAFIFTPGGKLSRVLYGITFPEKSLRLALNEASGGKIGTAWDKVILFCYHYDPSAKGYTLAATRVMRAGGAVTLLAIALFIGLMVRSNRRGRDSMVGKNELHTQSAVTAKNSPSLSEKPV